MPSIIYGSSYGTLPDAQKSLGSTFLPGAGFGGTAPWAAYQAVQDNNIGTSASVAGPTNSNKYLCFKITDSTIPTASTGGSVVIGWVADQWQYNHQKLSFCKYKTFATALGTPFVYNDPQINFSNPVTTDGVGSALTGANFQTTGWGVQCSQIAAETGVYLYELQVKFTFTLPTPGVLSSMATGVTQTGATLNGVISPNTATSTYPVNYMWRWGTDPGSLPNTVLGTSDLTGTEPINVSTPLTSLAAATQYYFELVAWPVGDSPPPQTSGGVASFSTIGATTNIIKLASF